jgi:hypothetical protein
MSTSTKSDSVPVDHKHPLYDRSRRRLQEIVDICMGSHDGMPLFNVLLSRVLTIGEEVAVGPRIFRVIGVQHSPLDLDGRATFGTHAHLTVVEVPDAGWLTSPEQPSSRKPRRERGRTKSAAPKQLATPDAGERSTRL